LDDKEKANVFESIINDAKIPKVVTLEWDGKTVEIKYKELIGDEDIEIERKFGDDMAGILLEKTFIMIHKANNGAENDISREQWSVLPGKFRTAVALKLNLDEQKQAELFQNFRPTQQGSS